jgi:quinohemoprotein ethanol dehydrogenase
VLDRASGELISATPYVSVNWTKGIDAKTGRPIPNAAANYTQQARRVFPSAAGGHSWPGMAFDPKRTLAFIPARETGFIFSLSVPTWFEQVHGSPVLTREPAAVGKRHGVLLAWNPLTRKPAWQVVLKTQSNGGVLATAGGLVVQGTQDGYLRFYSADNGKLLHQIFTGTGIVAPPIAYELDGVQYFAIATGWSGVNTEPEPVDAPAPYINDARLIVLKLDGTSVPVAPRKQLAPFLAVDDVQDPKRVAKGAGTFLTYCAICHGHVGEQTLFPDLRRISKATYDNFDAIVLGGALKGGGMASFGDVLRPEDTAAVRAFLVDWAQRSRRNDPSARQMPPTGTGTANGGQ